MKSCAAVQSCVVVHCASLCAHARSTSEVSRETNPAVDASVVDSGAELAPCTSVPLLGCVANGPRVALPKRCPTEHQRFALTIPVAEPYSRSEVPGDAFAFRSAVSIMFRWLEGLLVGASR